MPVLHLDQRMAFSRASFSRGRENPAPYESATDREPWPSRAFAISSEQPEFRKRSFIEWRAECVVLVIPSVPLIHLLTVLLAWVALMSLSDA